MAKKRIQLDLTRERPGVLRRPPPAEFSASLSEELSKHQPREGQGTSLPPD
jgi:hypothetical protein